MGLRKPADPRKRKSYRGQEIPAFCLNMQARRIELMLTQEELGRLINAPKTRISEIESGRFPSDPERIISIAKALECSVDWLLGVDSVTSPPPYVRPEVVQDIERIVGTSIERFGFALDPKKDREKAKVVDSFEVLRFFQLSLVATLDIWLRRPPD